MTDSNGLGETFTLFPDLPLEVRRKIWASCLPSPAVYRFRLRVQEALRPSRITPMPDGTTVLEPRDHGELRVQTRAARTLLSTTRESRTEILFTLPDELVFPHRRKVADWEDPHPDDFVIRYPPDTDPPQARLRWIRGSVRFLSERDLVVLWPPALNAMSHTDTVRQGLVPRFRSDTSFDPSPIRNLAMGGFMWYRHADDDSRIPDDGRFHGLGPLVIPGLVSFLYKFPALERLFLVAILMATDDSTWPRQEPRGLWDWDKELAELSSADELGHYSRALRSAIRRHCQKIHGGTRERDKMREWLEGRKIAILPLAEEEKCRLFRLPDDDQ